MVETKIISGSANVVSSGSVFSFNKAPISITINFPDFPLTVIFKFIDSLNYNKHYIEAKTPNSSILEIECHNFNSQLGTGSISPMQIGTYQGQYLYMNMRVHHMEKSDKILHYTFYLSEEVI